MRVDHRPVGGVGRAEAGIRVGIERRARQRHELAGHVGQDIGLVFETNET